MSSVGKCFNLCAVDVDCVAAYTFKLFKKKCYFYNLLEDVRYFESKEKTDPNSGTDGGTVYVKGG